MKLIIKLDNAPNNIVCPEKVIQLTIAFIYASFFPVSSSCLFLNRFSNLRQKGASVRVRVWHIYYMGDYNIEDYDFHRGNVY